MEETDRIRVAVNGYGVIGKRVAEAVAQQDDMALTGRERDAQTSIEKTNAALGIGALEGEARP